MGQRITSRRRYAVSTIAPVIPRWGYGDTLKATKKRTNDTLLFFGLIYRDGYSSDEGRKTIDRLSKIHQTSSPRSATSRYGSPTCSACRA